MQAEKKVNEDRDAADLQNTETILEYAFGAYQRSVDNFNALDSKASTLAGFIGLILTLAGGLWAVRNNQPSAVAANISALSIQIAYSATVLTLAAAFLCCLLTLRARKNLLPPLTGDVISRYQNLGAPEHRRRKLLKILIVTLQEAEKHRAINNQAKSSHLQRATGFLFLAVTFGMAGYMFQVAHMFGIFGGLTK